MIHNNPIASENVNVSIDEVLAEYQLTPLPVPCDEHETVGNAAGSFVQWPKELVTLRQDPVSLEKKKNQEVTSKQIVQKPKKIKSKGSVTPVKKTHTIATDDINSTEHLRSLRFLLNKRYSSKKSELFKFEEDGENTIYITYDDVDQFLTMSWLNIPILEIIIKYVTTLCNQSENAELAFMLPSRLAIRARDYQNQIEVSEYLTNVLVANKNKRFILAPYIQDEYWMLLLFYLPESVVYVFDLLKKERKIRLTTPARAALKLKKPEGGSNNNKKDFMWHHLDVQCPQQKGGTECGYFVMKHMHDIIMLSNKKPDSNWKVGLSSRSYTKKELNEIRDLWAVFFTIECL